MFMFTGIDKESIAFMCCNDNENVSNRLLGIHLNTVFLNEIFNFIYVNFK